VVRRPMVARPASDLYRTIHRQPEVVRSIVARDRPRARELGPRLARARRIILTGTGTSHHAAIVGEHLFRWAGVDSTARSAFEFVQYPEPVTPDDVVVVISHRGSKRYGSAAIPLAKGGGATVVGITGEASPMHGADAVLTTSPQETSSTHTMSYTGSLTVLALLAAEIARARGRGPDAFDTAIETLPAMLERTLAREEEVLPAAEALARSGRLTLQGGGPNAATAREGALKAKESSYLVAEGFELETFLHGGLQPLAAGDVAVPILPAGASVERGRDLLRALAIVEASTWLVKDEQLSDLEPGPSGRGGSLPSFPFPHVPEPLSPVLAVVPLQLLAAYTAQILGTNADSFREDDPTFKKAVGSYQL
jgi:glutamine---fructose-6-phosphate transaminase (isomerizing)